MRKRADAKKAMEDHISRMEKLQKGVQSKAVEDYSDGGNSDHEAEEGKCDRIIQRKKMELFAYSVRLTTGVVIMVNHHKHVFFAEGYFSAYPEQNMA